MSCTMSLFKKIFSRNKSKPNAGGAFKEFCKAYTMTDIVLGSGTYAEVRKAIRKSNGEIVAVKVIDKTGLSQKELGGLSKEVKILQSLKHRNVVKLYDSYDEVDTMYVVMEYVGGGELFTRIVSEDKPFTENDARKIVRTLGEALQHCKDRGVIHRDIKPQNLLLTTPEEGGELKLADFNLSIQVDPDVVDFSLIQTMCGTPNYVAPEILSQKPYDFKCDIWSLGVICYLLLSGGFLPFFVEEEGEVGKELLLRKVRKGKWGFYPQEAWQGVSDQAKDFLKRVMEKNPDKRLDYAGLLSHPWLKQETAFGTQPIDVKYMQQVIFKRQMQSASLVFQAAKKFQEMMAEPLEDEGTGMFDEGKLQDIQNSGNFVDDFS